MRFQPLNDRYGYTQNHDYIIDDRNYTPKRKKAKGYCLNDRCEKYSGIKCQVNEVNIEGKGFVAITENHSVVDCPFCHHCLKYI